MGVPAMSDRSSIPFYEPMLDAYHRAFASELRAMVAALPLASGHTVLDMACGDGAYSLWLADRVGPRGQIIGVDQAEDYVSIARRRAEESPLANIISFSAAPIESLPFEDGTFDFCWCAQSLYSLPDPVDALRHMLRVTKRGGAIAVLENDTLHHVILPWPIEVELTMRAAELRSLAQKSDKPYKYYVGRQLRRVFRSAGLQRIESRSFATDRAAPLAPNERTFLLQYLKHLAGRIRASFDGPSRTAFDRLVDPQSAEFILDDPDLAATFVNHVVWGWKGCQ
jgi:ubiquinone/menaquinone biosynthesis C-methylase UbiE